MFLQGINADEVVTQHFLLADRIRNGESLKMCGGADIMSGRPDGRIAGVDMIYSAVGGVLEVSKFVSTHIWNTPVNLYQQAIKGFLS